MNVLLLSILVGIPSIIFPASTVTGRSIPPTSQYVIPSYQSLPLFSRISRSDIPRTILLKNLLELDCIKQLYNQSNGNRKSRNKFGLFRNQGQMPRGPLFRYRGNVFNNRMSDFRQNQIQRVNAGDEKFLLTPVSYATVNQPTSLNYSTNWKPTFSVLPPSKNFFRPNFKEEINIPQTNVKESSMNAKVDSEKIKMENGLKLEEKEVIIGEEKFKNDKYASKNNENQRLFDESKEKLKFVDAHQMINNPVPLGNSKVPPHSYQVSRPKIIQPYEVEEIIEEDIRVDVKNEKEDDLANLNIDQPTAFNNEIELINDEPETSSQKIPNNAMEGLDNSINKILKGLILPPSAKEKTLKEVIGNNGDTWDKKMVTIIPPVLSTEASKYFSKNFYKENENLNQVEVAFDSNRNSDNRAKSLILKNERKNLMENASSPYRKLDFWRVHPVENNGFVEPSKAYPDPSDWENENRFKILEEKSNKFLNSGDSSEMDTTIQLADLFNFHSDSKPPRTETPLLSLPELFSFPIYTQKTKEQMTEDVIQLPNLQPNDSLYGQTFPNLPNDGTDLSNEVMPSTPKPFTNENNTDETEVSAATTKTIDQGEWPSGEVIQSELSEWNQTSLQLQADSDDQNKSSLTEPEETSKKSNEVELNFDPISETSKSEDVNLDAGFKNSRKMHYGQDVDNSLNEETEQRRSDILIGEAVNDYEDNVKENSPKKYLNVLEESILEKNFSVNSIVPNIASIINDLREGNLSPEEILLLSKATGKYWPSILALSNSTNFDMLPLLKMKTEDDLEEFLENSVKDENVEKTTLESVYDLTNDMDYDYDYKDLYQDIAVEDLDFKRKKFRPRREIDNHLEHLRTKKSFFYGPGSRDIIQQTKRHIRIKRNRGHDWREEAAREYFESLERERNENVGDYLYDEIFYSDLAEDKELLQAEMVQATDLQMSFHNMTSSL